MKSIYQKIILILVAAFFIQIVLLSVFYRQVALKKIISEINMQETKRQDILQEAMDTVQKFQNKNDKLEKTLDALSVKYKTRFVVRDIDGNMIFSTQENYGIKNAIEEHGNVKVGGKIAYIVYGYFPARISNLRSDLKQNAVSVSTGFIIILLSFITLLSIYIVLTKPLKKLSKAVNSLNYGNTIIEIPYHSNDELGLLCRNFEEMGKRLKQSEDSQQELIQAISHDIKTPLTSIIGYAKRLAEGKVSEERKSEYHDIIYRRASDLKSILDELDDYANINIEKKYSMSSINSFDYFTNLLNELKRDIEDRGHALEFSINVDKASEINVDIIKIKRVFANIIENSLKYAGEKCKININCLSDNENLKFKVCDNGPGVPENLLDRIFNKFYRVESSRSREKGGTGLGLAICKDIVLNHGGLIGAKNITNSGLCIWFTIPRIK